MTTWNTLPLSQRVTIEACLRADATFLWRGPSELLVSGQFIRTVIEVLTSDSVELVGLEAFELDGAELRPRLDLIYDRSRLPGFPSAGDFVATWGPDVWIDVTVIVPPSVR